MRLLLLLLTLIATFIAVPTAHAGDVVVVTITAQPWSTGDCPTGLTLTIASPYEVQLSWTPGNATSTMIRGAFDRWPTSPTDGFEVYNGNSSSVSHWLETDVMVLSDTGIYYKAWGESGGNYSLCYASGTVQGGEDVAAIGINMFTGVLGILALSLSGLAIWSKLTDKTLTWLFGAAGAAWIVLAMYTLSSGVEGSAYNAIGWLGIAMAILFFSAAYLYRDKPDIGEETTGWETELETRREERQKRYERRNKEEWP
jgi:hypothetical protein